MLSQGIYLAPLRCLVTMWWCNKKNPHQMWAPGLLNLWNHELEASIAYNYPVCLFCYKTRKWTGQAISVVWFKGVPSVSCLPHFLWPTSEISDILPLILTIASTANFPFRICMYDISTRWSSYQSKSPFSDSLEVVALNGAFGI